MKRSANDELYRFEIDRVWFSAPNVEKISVSAECFPQLLHEPKNFVIKVYESFRCFYFHGSKLRIMTKRV